MFLDKITTIRSKLLKLRTKHDWSLFLNIMYTSNVTIVIEV